MVLDDAKERAEGPCQPKFSHRGLANHPSFIVMRTVPSSRREEPARPETKQQSVVHASKESRLIVSEAFKGMPWTFADHQSARFGRWESGFVEEIRVAVEILWWGKRSIPRRISVGWCGRFVGKGLSVAKEAGRARMDRW